MDTKLKNQNKTLVIIGILFGVIAISVTCSLPYFKGRAQQHPTSLYTQPEFARNLYENGFVLYWELQQRKTGELLTPVEVFFPGIAAHFNADNSSMAKGDLTNFSNACYEKLANWRSRFNWQWSNLSYLVVDQNGYFFGNGNQGLSQIAAGSLGAEQRERLKEQYAFLAVLHYNGSGKITVPFIVGAEADTLNELQLMDMWDTWKDIFVYEQIRQGYQPLQPPQNMTVVYAIPQVVNEFSPLLEQQAFYEKRSFGNAGFTSLYVGMLLFSGLLAGILAYLRKIHIPSLARVPLEIWFVLLLFAVAGWELLAGVGVKVDQRLPLFHLFTGVGADVLRYVLSVVFVFGVLCTVFGAVVTIVGQVRRIGFQEYLREHTLCVRFFRWIKRKVHRIYQWLSSIDLSEFGLRNIGVILGLNFILLAVLCSLWFYGIFALMVYTVILFFILRKYVRDLNQKYAWLLYVTGEMVQGKLDVKIPSDLGVFNRLGQELEKVQIGFQQAVEAEVKSQNLKTELITNVSHDLKTPLTAIITYINLLKTENLSPASRSYVDTLDQKSQRLKQLIEDLFEMSKANSGSIALDLSPIDLTALLRQVEHEVKAEIEAAEIEFRHNYPIAPVCVLLDGEKTSRIFENLYLNIAKYGLAQTRAYVTITQEHNWVEVELKNVSREALDFDPTDITDRFVRGDQSRHTEGSGLGLAIAKSFAELQGGKLTIDIDGDLFKVIVGFILWEGPEDRPLEEVRDEEVRDEETRDDETRDDEIGDDEIGDEEVKIVRESKTS